MEVMLCVPPGTDIEVIRNKYPDIYRDEGWDDHDRYFVGRPEEDGVPGDEPWMTYDECVEFCGFADGSIAEADTLIDGNGGWAQGLVTQTAPYRQAFTRGMQLRS